MRLLEKLDKTEPSDLEALIAEADNEESEPMTGDDWKRPELRDRYAGWYSTYLARRLS